MGNSQKKPKDYQIVSSFIRDDWITIQNLGKCQVWRHRNMNLYVQAYKLAYKPNIDELNCYQFRNENSQSIINVHYIILDNKDSLCSSDKESYALIERIPYRLSDINGRQLNLSQALTILKGSYSGFNTIASFYGPVEPNSDMIGFNMSGIIKVWLNSNISLNKPKNNQNLQKQENKQQYIKQNNTLYVRKIFQMVEQRVVNGRLPTELKKIFYQKENLNYFQAHNLIEEYADTYNVVMPKEISLELFCKNYQSFCLIPKHEDSLVDDLILYPENKLQDLHRNNNLPNLSNKSKQIYHSPVNSISNHQIKKMHNTNNFSHFQSSIMVKPKIQFVGLKNLNQYSTNYRNQKIQILPSRNIVSINNQANIRNNHGEIIMQIPPVVGKTKLIHHQPIAVISREQNIQRVKLNHSHKLAEKENELIIQRNQPQQLRKQGQRRQHQPQKFKQNTFKKQILSKPKSQSKIQQKKLNYEQKLEQNYYEVHEDKNLEQLQRIQQSENQLKQQQQIIQSILEQQNKEKQYEKSNKRQLSNQLRHEIKKSHKKQIMSQNRLESLKYEGNQELNRNQEQQINYEEQGSLEEQLLIRQKRQRQQEVSQKYQLQLKQQRQQQEQNKVLIQTYQKSRQIQKKSDKEDHFKLQNDQIAKLIDRKCQLRQTIELNHSMNVQSKRNSENDSQSRQKYLRSQEQLQESSKQKVREQDINNCTEQILMNKQQQQPYRQLEQNIDVIDRVSQQQQENLEDLQNYIRKKYSDYIEGIVNHPIKQQSQYSVQMSKTYQPKHNFFQEIIQKNENIYSSYKNTRNPNIENKMKQNIKQIDFLDVKNMQLNLDKKYSQRQLNKKQEKDRKNSIFNVAELDKHLSKFEEKKISHVESYQVIRNQSEIKSNMSSQQDHFQSYSALPEDSFNNQNISGNVYNQNPQQKFKKQQYHTNFTKFKHQRLYSKGNSIEDKYDRYINKNRKSLKSLGLNSIPNQTPIGHYSRNQRVDYTPIEGFKKLQPSSKLSSYMHNISEEQESKQKKVIQQSYKFKQEKNYYVPPYPGNKQSKPLSYEDLNSYLWN